MRLSEIEARLNAIATECETATGDALTALENEARTLMEERTRLLAEVQQRRSLRASIAAGNGSVVEPRQPDGQPETRTFARDSAEYRAAYLGHLQGRTLTAQERAAVTATAAIPTQTMNKIYRYVEESPILSRIDLTFIPGNVSLPVEDTVADASWVAMGTASTVSADKLTAITLGAYKLIKTVEINADTQSMSIDAFEDWLVTRLGEKLEKAMDNAVFNGTGSGQPTGICKTLSTATGTFTKAKATYADLVKILAALPSGPAKNATFTMQRKLFFTDVVGITDAQGQPVCHHDVESPAKYNILGYHVVLDDNVPADTILFGDLFAFKMNVARDMDITPDDSVGFLTGSRVWRGMLLADGKLATSTAFVRFNRATA